MIPFVNSFFRNTHDFERYVFLIMSSSILYKFRSGTTFEALPLPGSSARLLDIKKAIVTAKKLDQGSMDFDLSVKDANTGAEYQDESAILPRGTRLIVHRLPAQRGQGILAKIARSQYGGGYHSTPAVSSNGVPSDFYTIDSRANDDDEEFISTSAAAQTSIEEQELAALRAATETAAIATSVPTSHMTSFRGGRGGLAGAGAPPPRTNHFHHHNNNNNNILRFQKPNADPELREQEAQPKKRATGIPRTFLNLSAPPSTDGTSNDLPQIQPNTIGFEELVQRGGGQSENVSGTQRDLDYAIKLTATTIPEYLQCAICEGVVRDAMMLPWDPEGRTTCERCVRDALTQSGFRCPLTQQEGVSPDDLLPNHALRKAADQFVKEVMHKIQEINEQAKIEEEIAPELTSKDGASKVLEGDRSDSGVVLTRRASAVDQKRKKEEEDPFGGGDDDFGGDVFAFEAKEPEQKPEASATESKLDSTAQSIPDPDIKVEEITSSKVTIIKTTDMDVAVDSVEPVVVSSESAIGDSPSNSEVARLPVEALSTSPVNRDTDNNPKREIASRRRGPPAGYTMGPAGVTVNGLEQNIGGHVPSPPEAPHDVRSFRGGSRGAGRRGGSFGPRYDSGHPRGGGRGNAFFNNENPPRNDVSFF